MRHDTHPWGANHSPAGGPEGAGSNRFYPRILLKNKEKEAAKGEVEKLGPVVLEFGI